MNNKRSIAIALAVVVIIGLGSLTLNPQRLPFAAGPEPSADEHAHESGQGHAEEPGHADEAKNRTPQPRKLLTKRMRDTSS